MSCFFIYAVCCLLFAVLLKLLCLLSLFYLLALLFMLQTGGDLIPLGLYDPSSLPFDL